MYVQENYMEELKMKSEIDVFCKNIRQIRSREGLSKTAMAKMLGIGVQSLTKIENGILPARLSCKIFENIYFHFGIVPKALFTAML